MNKIILLTMVYLLLTSTTLHAVRAGMDFTFLAHENGSTEKVSCDFCGYSYKNSKVRVVTLSASARHGVVSVFFLPSADIRSAEWGAIIHPQQPILSDDHEFEVDSFQKVQLREGQIVRLRGTQLKFELIDVFGVGCPPGARCSLNLTSTA